MMRIVAVFLLFAFSCGQSETEQILEPDIFAEANFVTLAQIEEGSYRTETKEIGTASFSQAGTVVTLEIRLAGMTPNTAKAVHIHNGSLETPGRHWNRGSFYASCSELSLGRSWNKLFAGDVGNVPIDADGNGYFTLSTDLWEINSGTANDVLDKIIIIHDRGMDFAEECNPAHVHGAEHSNPKIGGGNIRLISPVAQVDQVSISMPNPPKFTICK
ncbi:MAG: superoxide dismutase family protein [Ekhidna sp.]|nr:superoxide dismutase family protein [Ekhidna sp.]